MNLFDTLVLGHLVGDFLFQSTWMAEGKKKHIVPLIVHAIVYTLCVFVFSYSTNYLGWLDYFIIFGTHILIDSRKLTYWWMHNLMTITSAKESETWLLIAVDQIFHLLVFYILILIKAM
jgi:hypothetical protein